MWPEDPKYGFYAAREAKFLYNVALETFEFETPCLQDPYCGKKDQIDFNQMKFSKV